jgi:hypothetical protein
MSPKKLIILLTICWLDAFGQNSGGYNPSIDVLHYRFNIRLSDKNDSLFGTATITVRFTEKTKQLQFDLMNINDTGYGMLVSKMSENNREIAFTHTGDKIHCLLPYLTKAGQEKTFRIEYRGIPADGLIISENKFHHRTIFADNWPNRARYWIPCKDHLSDKASVEFLVTAPDHYKVVSNGVLKEEKDLPGQMKYTHWDENTPIATKIMVIGLADFAVDYPATINGIPISSWIFPEQKEAGFYDYAQAAEILPFYIKNIGPFSYPKLANVQSKTIFGGMENAGAIFYSENSVTGKRKSEDLLAHEMAHQWFGDAATETDWPHLWLSEGFATEMTNLYLENKYGTDTLRKRLEKDRQQVISFTKKIRKPVVDTSAANNPMTLLNANSYQKGGWVLEMLRQQLGEPVFWTAISNYYAAYQNKNASTDDLQKKFEEASGKDLDYFFKQWLYTPENPDIEIHWSYNRQNKKIILTVTQKTSHTFVFPLELKITDADGTDLFQTIHVSKQTENYQIAAASKPVKWKPDPSCRLLFEAAVSEIQE